MQCSCKQGSYADVTVPEANGVLHSDTNVLTVNPSHLLHWLLMLWWPAQNSQYLNLILTCRDGQCCWQRTT